MSIVFLYLAAVCMLWTGVSALELPSRLRSAQRIITKSHGPHAHSTSNTQLQAAVAPKVELNALDLCLAGAFATAFGDFVMHPIDTIKITQQTAGKTITNAFFSSFILLNCVLC